MIELTEAQRKSLDTLVDAAITDAVRLRAQRCPFAEALTSLHQTMQARSDLSPGAKQTGVMVCEAVLRIIYKRESLSASVN